VQINLLAGFIQAGLTTPGQPCLDYCTANTLENLGGWHILQIRL
jgi:hypothetical protein